MRAVVAVRTESLAQAAEHLHSVADRVRTGAGPTLVPDAGDPRLDDLLRDLAELLPRHAGGLAHDLWLAGVFVGLAATRYEHVETLVVR